LDLGSTQRVANRRPWTNQPDIPYVVPRCGNKSSSCGYVKLDFYSMEEAAAHHAHESKACAAFREWEE
jgi:hypothetical protein